ncbi:MAG: hypothetical protein KAJ18_10370 [Candidatus Omnitrophica bacterium]|nr:hypothetical protein [Candidatus Omnitrophota bacterium]
MQTVIRFIIQFCNTYFEILLAIMVYLFIGMAVVIVAAKIRNISIKALKGRVQSFMFFLVVGVEVLLVFLSAAIFLSNLGKKPKLDLTARVLASTEWVNDELEIYFIVDKALVSIQSNGSGRRNVFEARDEIVEYHFSPDGTKILILTTKDLIQHNLKDLTSEVIASLHLPETEERVALKGVINGIRWAPDNQKICYRLARWSRYSSHDQWYIYDTQTKTKQAIVSPAVKIASLVWDKDAEDLYYIWFEALDTSIRGNPYEVKVYRVSSETLKPEQILKFPFDQAIIPDENLAVRGVDVFRGADDLSFGRSGKKRYSWVSEQGPKLGIDEDDMLYYVRDRWWRRRLYQVPRVVEISAIPKYQYDGGKLAIQYVRWLPSGRYVIMEHHFYGVLIMEPETGKIGILVNEKGNTFGWY